MKPKIHSAPCIFCYEQVLPRIIKEYGSAVAIFDGYPVTPGHTLVIPKRHVEGYFELTDPERRDADALIGQMYRRLTEEDPTISGYNIGLNCGAVAGQTIFHAHYHLIPRRAGDTDNPRGGVRGAIRGMRNY